MRYEKPELMDLSGKMDKAALCVDGSLASPGNDYCETGTDIIVGYCDSGNVAGDYCGTGSIAGDYCNTGFTAGSSAACTKGGSPV